MIRLGKKRSDQRAILKDGKRDVAWDMWSQIHSLDVVRPRPLYASWKTISKRGPRPCRGVESSCDHEDHLRDQWPRSVHVA